MGGKYRKVAKEHGGEKLGARQPEESFSVDGTTAEMKISVYTSKSNQQERKGRTGSAVDSNSPQSRTRPVIRPAERRASKWLEANDMDGT